MYILIYVLYTWNLIQQQYYTLLSNNKILYLKTKQKKKETLMCFFSPWKLITKEYKFLRPLSKFLLKGKIHKP